MANERCEDCIFCADLDKLNNKTSLCCVAFPVVYNAGYVTETFSDGRCELFTRRDNDG